MKIFRFLLIIIGIFFLLLFTIPIFLPNRAYTEREILIDKNIDSVFNFIIDLNNFIKWNPWTEMEKDFVLTVSNNNGLGSKVEWDGDTLGTGYLERTEVKNNELIKSKVVFFKPWQSEALDIMKFKKIGENKTSVIWGMSMELDYPFGRYFNFFYDQIVGNDHEKGLRKIKNYIEKN